MQVVLNITMQIKSIYFALPALKIVYNALITNFAKVVKLVSYFMPQIIVVWNHVLSFIMQTIKYAIAVKHPV